MALSIYMPEEVAVGIAQQTTWGTIWPDASAFDQIVCDKPELTADVRKRDHLAVTGARWEDVANMARDEVGANPTLKLPDHFVRKKQLAVILFSFFQNVTEAGSTPYKKTFTFHDTQPDFTAVPSTACFLTACMKMPVASNSLKVKDLICRSISLKCAPGGLLSLSADFIGRGAMVLTGNPSGTWTAQPVATTTVMNFYPFEKMVRYTYDFAGAASPGAGAWELNAQIGKVIPVGQSAGFCQSFAIGQYGGTFKGSIMWNSTEQAFLTNYPLGTPVTINAAWGNATAGTDDGDLDITAYGVLDEVSINPADVLMIDYTVKLGGSVANVKEPLTIILSDATHKTWGD